MGGPFMWLRAAGARELGSCGLDGGPKAVWRAMHDGYRRLSPSACHERTVILHRDMRRVVVEDLVRTAGRHSCRLARLRWQSSTGQWRAIMRLPEQLEWSAVRGRTDPPLGWYSPCFGARLPIVTLLGRGVVTGGERLLTEMEIEFQAGHPASTEPSQVALADG